MDQKQNYSENFNSLYDPDFEHDACGVAFVADIKGKKSHEIVRQSLTALKNLQHRGASGFEKNTGDGAGITLQIPHDFFLPKTEKLNIALPKEGDYGVGMVFFPSADKSRQICEKYCEQEIKKSGLTLLGWRKVPQNNVMIGEMAKSCEPVIYQWFIKKPAGMHADTFERKLYLTRRKIENAIETADIPEKNQFYLASFSSKTIVYKGMLSADQITVYFPDLVDPLVKSALALTHQRFSTNTFPSWPLAHPFRYLAHNGEINTLQGNKNALHSREHLFASKFFGKEIKHLLPVIRPNGSDSSSLDNVTELLVMTGRNIAHSMMMLIPEPWSGHKTMDETKKAFYDYHQSLTEPWDGPALVAFTDGTRIGAVLDRNGLRPARYYVTKDGRLIMASEAGVIKVDPENILYKGRLQPGRMLLVDTLEQRIVPDEELKKQTASAMPYAKWLKKYRVKLENIPVLKKTADSKPTNLLCEQTNFGYTEEEKQTILRPMAVNAHEALGSMGNDTPIAVLSNQPQLLYNYFQQLFAQVTNPPIDAIREELVTSMKILVGGEGDLLEASAKNCRQIELSMPVLTDEQLEAIRRFRKPGFKTKLLPALFKAQKNAEGLETALENLFKKADKAIEKDYTILILSDKGSTKKLAPIPALLAASGLHHYLVAQGTRTKVSIIVQTGEAREAHHFCCLIGYGATAVNPYLAFETIRGMINDRSIDPDYETASQNYINAINRGILKVMSRMGISTLNGYRGAQIFEAIGLNKYFIDKYFTGTSSRIQGVGIEAIAKETLLRHGQAFSKKQVSLLNLGGEYKWRKNGIKHFYTPEVIFKLQHAVRTDQYSIFKEFTKEVDNINLGLATIRGLLEIKYPKESIPESNVEPVESIAKHFLTAAISYGAISQEAHETLAIAMNRIGAKSNTGEGGEDPDRYQKKANGDSLSSAVKQVASGRFGVTEEYLVNAREIQIKMAQGAKPGEGGQLPGAKVYPWIAKVRHSIAGVTLISPPPHHDIYSIEDLAQLIYDLKNANPEALIGVKLVSQVGVGTVAAGVAKAHADKILISGHDGGTGAAPLTSIKHAGIPWEIGLAETQQVLLKNGLRSRVTLQVDGQMKTGRDVIIAALLGAEEYGFATIALTALGCVMMRVCHLDTCPVGIATQNPVLRQRFSGKPEYVQNYFIFLAQEVREYLAKLGVKKLQDLVGRNELLNFRPALDHWKAKGLDLSALLTRREAGEKLLHCTESQDHGLSGALDYVLIKKAKKALENKRPIRESFNINNTNRTTGTMLGYEITKRYGGDGLPADTIKFTFYGSAGQSFGAFIPSGLTLILTGDANDHVGKGLSGGKIIIYPPKVKDFIPEENIIIGNVALYGATSGEAYINGIAGERFAVRNSGGIAVVEGVGDHGCEYMTGGIVAILGSTGRNFAAGMSGGVAYVLDENKNFRQNCNPEMVELEKPSLKEKIEIKNLVKQHYIYTESPKAKKILKDWKIYNQKFIKVIPKEYKHILLAKKVRQKQILNEIIIPVIAQA